MLQCTLLQSTIIVNVHTVITIPLPLPLLSCQCCCNLCSRHWLLLLSPPSLESSSSSLLKSSSSLLSSLLLLQRHCCHKADCHFCHRNTYRHRMIPFIFLYGGGHSVIVDGDCDCDIRRRRNGLVVIIHIILLAVFCVLWRQIGGIGPNKGIAATALP